MVNLQEGTKATSEIITITYDQLEEAILNWMYDNKRGSLSSDVVIDDLGIDIAIPLNQEGKIEFEYHYITFDDEPEGIEE